MATGWSQDSLRESFSSRNTNTHKEKSTALLRFVIICKGCVTKTPLPKGSGNLIHYVSLILVNNLLIDKIKPHLATYSHNFAFFAFSVVFLIFDCFPSLPCLLLSISYIM